MGILAALHHVTDYEYDRQIQLGPQVIRLRPAPHARAAIRSYSLKVSPGEHYINWQQDPFGNFMARIVFPKKVSRFRVEVDLVTEVRVFNPLDFFLEDCATSFPFSYDEQLESELNPYLEVKESGPLLRKFLSKTKNEKQPTVEFLSTLNKQLSDDINYTIRLEPGIQTCEETLSIKTASCRDMAWLLCQILRHFGLATRFASGYLIQLKQDIPSLDGPSGAEEDFTDLHAWTEVYLPGAGWVGLDPTSGLFTGEGHIPLSCTPNPSSAAPISGAIESCESIMSHSMSVTRIHEDPRSTQPLSEIDWKEILELGEKVDGDLKRQDVRLTMGGEPTFVSLDDPQGQEWSYTALSPEKYTLAIDLMRRLKARLAPGGLLQHSQGKWYPGEPLPRWSISCISRKDQEPVWTKPELLANPQEKQGCTIPHGRKMLETLAENLGIPSSYIMEAHEDSPYYLWKEQRLPNEGDIFKCDLFEKKERQRLQKLMDEGLNTVTGFVLPLQYSLRRDRWISSRWEFRNNRLVLIPGDSPLGLRLPLASLPYLSENELEIIPERSPFEQEGDLPSHKSLLKASESKSKADVSAQCRTALCVEIRNGILHLFLPPFAHIEHFLELVAMIEKSADEIGIKVLLEGYAPPSDLRVQQWSVTPDPGVLEVNTPPTESWSELTSLTATIYEESRAARLTTEKFLIDGRLVGTGGGNHIVVGGSHPLNSPFLRKPSLLRSLISFWQNHPSLSYLFSAQYIGPTCQAPRIDEARHDSLYELNIAFQQIPESDDVPPWLVDRLFRNLLVDLTGNTHRAEFCIDKLYSPDSSRGRLGLVEMRGFEMTPHYRMNLVQALLVRAAIAQFWQKPYRHALTPWGTRLHDKFMLPEYVWSDFCSALEAIDYDFDQSWFLPFMEFRFPLIGKVQLGTVTIELRHALEPWPILGEEMYNGGTSRAVDSSVERVQVKVSGLVEGRHEITCNGIPIRLQPCAETGVAVAGVRFKAWAPYSSLHPNIPVHSPLVFDLVDKVHQRSLGGCKYHVMHQGGRSYETFPVNGNEAEGRRLARFETMGHSPGNLARARATYHPDFPYTLDLRLQSWPKHNKVDDKAASDEGNQTSTSVLSELRSDLLSSAN